MPDNNPVNDQRIPLFLRKLWTLVNSPDTNNVITWSKEGDSFIIKSQVAFCDVLPRYFKHNNFMSFVRQLHIYGFSKRISDVDHTSNHGSSSSCEYAHPYFQKDHSCLLLSIKQKRGEKVQQNIKPDIDSIDTISNLIKEVNQVKDKNKLLDSKFIAMKHENECLWRELAVIRQKHMKQQRILNQLIQFLVTLRQPRNNDALCREVKNNVRYVLPIMHHKPSEKNTKYKPSTSSGPVIHELDPSDIIINSSDNENNSVAVLNEVVEPEDVVLSPSSVSQILSSPRSSIAEEVLLPNEVIANSPLDDLIREVSVSPTDDLLESKSTFIPIYPSTSIPDTAPLFNSSGKRTKHDSSIKKKPHISNETKSFKVESLRNPYIVNVETDGNNPPVISIPDTEVLDPGVSIPNDNILWNEISPKNNMQLANPEPRQVITHSNNSSVLTDFPLIIEKDSVSKHIDSVQADLENILKGLNDKYTFDANTFLNFINEDPTSLSLPITTEEQLLNDSKNELNVTHDNQIVSCMSPNTYDLNDLMSASVDWSVPSTPISFETIGENNDVLNTPVIGDPMMNADSYFTPSTKPAKK